MINTCACTYATFLCVEWIHFPKILFNNKNYITTILSTIDLKLTVIAARLTATMSLSSYKLRKSINEASTLKDIVDSI